MHLLEAFFLKAEDILSLKIYLRACRLKFILGGGYVDPNFSNREADLSRIGRIRSLAD